MRLALLFSVLSALESAQSQEPLPGAAPTGRSACRSAFDSHRHEGIRPRTEDPLVTRDVSFEVDRPRDRYVVDFFVGAANLENFLPGTADLPGVAHNEPIDGGDFPAVGSRRLVCLTGDGSALEEVLAHEPYSLRYLVTDYTVAAAHPIAYAIGEFQFDSLAPARTRARWRYSFSLRRNAFLGALGPLGRFLFRICFVDRTYAAFMASAVERMSVWLVPGGGATQSSTPSEP